MKFKLGRKRSIAPRPRLRLASYLGALPEPPASVDYSAKAAAALAEMYANDELGDCVIACGMHLVGVVTGNATGSPWRATKAQVLAQYEAIGGYVPGHPNTDQGCNEQDALDYWTHAGFPDGSKLLGALNVAASNETHVKQAIYLFENLIFGIELPDAWVESMPEASGFVWDVAGPPNPENGHCVLGVGYTAEGIIISTWGMLGVITWAAVAKYCAPAAGGELHVALSPEELAAGMTKAPNGVAWADLIGDFNALGGDIPAPPAPAPAPAPPPPAPTASPTLQQVKEWIREGLATTTKPMLSRGVAARLAEHGVASRWPGSS